MSSGISINSYSRYASSGGSTNSDHSASLYGYHRCNFDNSAIRNGVSVGSSLSSPKKIRVSNLNSILDKNNLSCLVRDEGFQSNNVRTILDLPSDLILLIVSSITSQSDLISLKLANSRFEPLVNEKLYRNIQISDLSTYKRRNFNMIQSYRIHINNNLTFLPVDKLFLFLKTIVNNRSLATQFIQCIHFKIDSLSLDNYREEFKTLIQLFSTTDIPVIIHNYANLKYFNECNDFLNSNGLRNGDFYENDGTPNSWSYQNSKCNNGNSSGYFNLRYNNQSQKMIKVMNYTQLCTIQDLDDITSNTTHLALYRNSSGSRFYDTSFKRINGVHKLPLFINNLISLHLNTPNITNKFFQLLDNAFTENKSILQKMDLESLSIHSGHSQFQKNLVTFSNLSRYINFLSLKNLEIKYRCDTNDYCLLEFMNDWSTHSFDEQYDSFTYFKNEKSCLDQLDEPLTNNNFRFIEKFSLVFTEENNKINEQYCLFVENVLIKFQNLKYLYISLNDFHSPAYNRFINVNVNYDSYTPLFTKLQQLSNLQTLIIPDFFYIFNVYLGENFSNFLNNCNCFNCHKSRRLFFEVSKMFSTSSNENEKQIEIRRIMDNFKENDFFVLHDNLDVEYFFTFFTIIHSLRQRLGTGINNLTSNLDLLKTVPNSIELHDDISILGESVDLVINLILHCLLDTNSMRDFLLNSKKLKLMILGGIYFKVTRNQVFTNSGVAEQQVKIESVFDQFSKTYK